MRKIYVRDGAQFVWQWQPKEHIVLEGYPDGVFVRYANCDTVEAPVVQTRREGGKLIADIPPELMMTDKDITIYVCNEGGIIHCHFLSVVSTPKPESYIYEPVEVLRYDTLAERIRLIEDWIAAGGSAPGGGDIPASPSFDEVNIGGAEGFYITSSGEPERPRAELFGANGDEQVELGNIARATHLNSAVPLWQANEMIDAVAETIPRSAADIGADPVGTAAAAVSAHNVSSTAHNDIRIELRQLAERINTALNSEDVDLDQLAEIVAYIKSNKALIDAITTSKVSVSDIVDNLVTNAANKPLSAAQGVMLRTLVQNLANTVSGLEDSVKDALTADDVDEVLAEAKKSGAFDGADGRGIASITRTSGNGAAGTVDTYTINYTDGTKNTYQVRNGANGTNGTNGKTPVKGTDYFTDADKAEMVSAVIEGLPKWSGGAY